MDGKIFKKHYWNIINIYYTTTVTPTVQVDSEQTRSENDYSITIIVKDDATL